MQWIRNQIELVKYERIAQIHWAAWFIAMVASIALLLLGKIDAGLIVAGTYIAAALALAGYYLARLWLDR